MGAQTETATSGEPSRRSVVPEAAGRSVWLAAVWTGLGAAVVCATVAIVAVAILWLPVSGTTGRTNSSIRAGLLTFLASVHGGVTVDGVSGAFLPLGMLLIVALACYRAGTGLGDAATALREQDPVRLALVGLAQAATFTVGCLVAVPFAMLGTSRTPFLGVGAGAFLLFALAGGTAFVRSCPLRAWVGERTPSWLGPVLRAATAAVAVYLAAGAVLVAGSLIVHHDTVELLSRRVGGGWGGVPILLLGILAAPNAVIAGAAYLTGTGFTVGSGTTAGLLGTTHGTLPAFPLLAAVPAGPTIGPVAWTVAALVALAAAAALTRIALRVDGWGHRALNVVGAALVAALIMLVLAWQGGGSLGDGRLRTVGASPWRLGVATGALMLVVSFVCLGTVAVWRLVFEDADYRPTQLPKRAPLVIVMPPHATAPVERDEWEDWDRVVDGEVEDVDETDEDLDEELDEQHGDDAGSGGVLAG